MALPIRHGMNGRPRRFKSPEQMWDECLEYFQWLEDNPLLEAKPFPYQGAVKIVKVSKMRAATFQGLTLFLGISQECWGDYRERKGFSEVTKRVDLMIYEQKFTGAAAELFNPNIIARDLGLSEKIETDQKINVITSEPQTPEQWEAEHTE